MIYLKPNTLKNVILPKSFTFIPANCDRVLTYKESMNICLGVERVLEIQFYMLVTKGYQFLDEQAIEEMLLRPRNWRHSVRDDVVNLYIQCMKQSQFRHFFEDLERDSRRKLTVIE